VIIVDGLGKRLRRFHPDRPRTLQEAVIGRFRFLRPTEYFWALRDVVFAVARGQTVGIVGHNGAGKSTLLRLIGGVGRPDEGSVRVDGRIGSLLDLGVGFHPELTGRENVFVSGTVCGLTRREMKQRLQAIVDFAELSEFIDSPLRTYSQGMQMRLAFSVATHVDPDVLLIDEVLAVGDMAFQQKCLERIESFKARGCAIVIVSHDVGMIGELCDQALLFDKGRLLLSGPPDAVVRRYVQDMRARTRELTPAHKDDGSGLTVNENRFGSLEVEITGVALRDSGGATVDEIESGEMLSIEMSYRAAEPVAAPIFGITMVADDGTVCFSSSTESDGLTVPDVHGTGSICVRIDRLDLSAGLYHVDVGAYRSDWTHAYDYHWHAYPLRVRAPGGTQGVLRPPHRWSLAPLTTSLDANR
jgi:lipopolysaccharide transport system ATP-binding protein